MFLVSNEISEWLHDYMSRQTETTKTVWAPSLVIDIRSTCGNGWRAPHTGRFNRDYG